MRIISRSRPGIAAVFVFLVSACAAEAGSASYRYYRFTPVKLRDGGANSVQLAEFEFHLGAAQTGAPVATNPGGRNPGAETPPKAVDGDIDTKWLDFNKGPLVFDFGAPESIDSYRWATANDVPDRDPVRWTLEGGDDGLNWTLLDDRTGADYPTPASRHTFTPALALNQLPDTPSIQFTATDGTVTSDTAIAVPSGTQITLHWDVAESTGVTLDTGSGPQSVPATGSTEDTPAATLTYTLVATNAAGSVTATVTVFVDSPVLSPVINEFMADSTLGGVLLDEDGNASDWLEIHNPNPFAVGMGGYYLTDASLVPDRWQIPPGTTIPPAGYMIVFASGKDRATPGAELHTNFSIKKSGEYLALVEPDGVTVADEYAPEFPAQFEDVSYGRVPPVAAGTFDFFTAPTPGFANDTAPGPPGEKVVFAPLAQTFTGSLDVALSVTSPTATIRYTTDGSLPGDSSPIYSAPIHLTNSALVRARSYDAGLAPGKIKAEAYIEIDGAVAAQTSDLPVVILENFGAGSVPADRDLQAAYFTLHEPDAATGRTDLTMPPADANRAGIKRRGSSTINDPKGNYRVEFWQDDSEEDKNINLLGMSDHDEWVLFAPYNFDRSLVRIPFIHDLSNAIGAYAPKGRLCEVYLNTGGGAVSQDDYQGVYVLQERISRGADRVEVERLGAGDVAEPEVTGGYILSIDRRDPEDQGFRSALGHPEDPAIASPQPWFNYIYPKEQNILPAQSAYIRNYIDDLEAALYGPDFKDPDTGYQAWLDCDASIDHHILVTFTKDPDGLRLSTFLYKARGRKLAFGPIWDFDRTMGCDGDDRASDPAGWDPPYETALFFEYDYWGRLFQDPDFMQRWIDRWQQLRDGEFSNSRLRARIDALSAEVAESQPRNAAKWPQVPPNGGPLSPLGGWDGEIDHLKNWLTQRGDWIDTQFTRRPSLQTGGAVHAGDTVTATAPDGTIYYTPDGTDPRLPGGGVNPAAQAVTGQGIVIGATTTVTARALDGGDWSGPVRESYIVGTPAAAANLVVSELMYHPSDPTDSEIAAGFDDTSDFEFLELRNVSGQPIDLTGVAIGEAFDFSFDNAAFTILDEGDGALVVRNQSAFEERYGTGWPVAGQWGDPEAPDGGSKLSNGGERILITGADASTILDFIYDDGPGWPQGADGDGPSLILSNPNSTPDHGLGSNWHDSLAPLGNPGAGYDDMCGEWQALHFTPAQLADPAISGLDADPDHDGLANLMELALAGDPWIPSRDHLPVASFQSIDVGGQTGDYFTISFVRRIELPGISIAVEFSDDLETWSPGGVMLAATDNLDGTETVTYRDETPASGTRRFARIVASKVDSD
jgi:hypothetical protein